MIRSRFSSMRWSALALAVMAAGCSFAPPTRPPAIPSPQHYAVQEDSTRDGASALVRPGAPIVPDWWRAYGSDTLNAWVEEGLKNNPSLDAARHTLEAVHQQYRAQAGDTMLPSLDAQGQVTRQRALGLPGFGPPTSLYNVYAGQLSLNYTFDVFGADRYSIKQAAARMDEQAFQLDAARRALAANIVITAVNASSLAEQLTVSERLSVLAHTQADLVGKAYALGAASHDDVLNARQNADAFDVNLPGLRAQSLRVRHALAVLLGRTPDQAPEPLPMDAWHVPENVPVSLPSDLLAQRPDVLAAEASLREASAGVGLATANLFPHISLSATKGSAAFKDSALFSAGSGIWSAGLSLTQPIFHGGALIAERKAAIASYDASMAQYRQTVLNAFQNVADTLVALEQDGHALQAAQASAAAAQDAFAESQSRYRLGAVAYPVTLSNEQRYQNARVAAIQTTAVRLADTAALFQAMGESYPTDVSARRKSQLAR
ncbi:efflux transporter outer membrane subunit [Dyella sp.]|uniref:efflux transporter outer membrane subunit n=1 Tax=Dyella sp. TaxID=1869338 RepID=UPI002ED42E1D